MVDYTTVRIKKSSLEKINKMKGDKGSVADIVEKLLSNVEGCNIEDILEVKRESVAISLEYSTFDENNNFRVQQYYDVTFQMLKNSKVGDLFYANSNPADGKYMNDIAEVIFVDGRSVLVRITEEIKTGNGVSSVVHIEHIDLF